MRSPVIALLLAVACGPDRPGRLARLDDATLTVTAVFDRADRLTSLVVSFETPPGRCPVLGDDLAVAVDGLALEVVQEGGTDPEDPFGRACLTPRAVHEASVDLVAGGVTTVEVSDATGVWTVAVEGLRAIAWDEIVAPPVGLDGRVRLPVGETVRILHHPATDVECLASDWCQHTALFLSETEEVFAQEPLYDVVDGVADVTVPALAPGPYGLLVTGFVPRVLSCDGPAVCRATRAGGIPDLLPLTVEAPPGSG